MLMNSKVKVYILINKVRNKSFRSISGVHNLTCIGKTVATRIVGAPSKFSISDHKDVRSNPRSTREPQLGP